VREEDSFAHAIEISKPYGCLDEVISWCKSECQADWRWQLVDMSTDIRPGRYVFYFDSDQDCLAFSLKWS